MRFSRQWGLTALCLGFAYGQAFAQATSVAPGRIEQDIRPAPALESRPPVILDHGLFPQQVPAGATEVSFVLGSVSLSGNTVIATADLSVLWAGKIGKQISLAQAFRIAQAISTKYRNAGYVLSQALVPAQEISRTGQAVLKIEILEGYVERVRITGLQSSRLQAIAAPIALERPLRMATLERSLLLLNEMAGVHAQSNLMPGDAANASVLEIVASREPPSFSASAHNRVAPSEGSVRYQANAVVDALLADFDQHTLGLVTSGDKRMGLVSYDAEVPLGSSGLKASASLSSSDSRTDSATGEVHTASNNITIGLNYPLLLSRLSKVVLRTSLGGYDNRSEVAAGVTSESRIRLWKTGLTADYSDKLDGVNLLDLEYSQGLSGLGASAADDPLLQGARPGFSKYALFAARLQNLGGNWSMLLALTAQASSDRMPTSEHLGLGGETFLRGYDPSEVIGENGSAGKLELRYNLALGSLGTTLYAYADAGQVSRMQLGGAPDLSYALASSGAGLRFSGPRRVKGFLEFAQPLNRSVASQGNANARVYAGLGIDF